MEATQGKPTGEKEPTGERDIDLLNPDELERLDPQPLEVDRSLPVDEPDTGIVKQNFVQKYTGKLYPCKACGKEKVREPRTGKIPEYCNDCKHDIQAIALKKSRLAKTRDIAFTGTREIVMPDGFRANVQSDDEVEFISSRVKQYLSDFEWKASADYSVLTRLILMELQANRITKLLTLKYRGSDAKVLAELSEEIRRCQQLLGIDRLTREKENSGDTPYEIVRKMMDKFNQYRKDHPERFMWKCRNCNHINSIALENPGVPKEGEKQPTLQEICAEASNIVPVKQDDIKNDKEVT
jgi:ribosomal protein L37AE/L43A